MATVSVSLPSDGETIDASDYNVPINTIVSALNGNLDADNLADGAVTSAKLADDLVISGWYELSGTHSVSTGYNNGNKSFDITTSADHSSTLSPGMRYKVSRSVTPPTQCFDAESGSSHYASKSSPTGITFTDDFTCEAWIKLESYTGSNQTIVSRFSSTGWLFRIGASGTVSLASATGGTDSIDSYQSIPLNKWTHVAAHIDMSGSTGKIYINGVEVPSAFTNGGGTSLTQAGDLEVGSANGGSSNFDGKIADVRVWSDIRTATEIQDNMNQALTGSETNLVGYWKLDGDFTDETSNSNDLTAQNSAVATNSDHPWSATEYGIITAVTSSTITVFTGTDHQIPNETLSSPFYSTQSTPFGFPRGEGKWVVETIILTEITQSSPTNGTWYNPGSTQLKVPVGDWIIEYDGAAYASPETGAGAICGSTLSTSSSAVDDKRMNDVWHQNQMSSPARMAMHISRSKGISLESETTYYWLIGVFSASINNLRLGYYINGNTIKATCAYL